MTSVTADTNIYISALHFGGQPLRFLNLARAGAVQVDISEPILLEILRVLKDKFLWESDKLSEVEALMRRFAKMVHPTVTLDVVKEDPPDNRVLECAIEAGSSVIISGDGDLLRLGRYDNIPIIRVADYLKSAFPVEAEF